MSVHGLLVWVKTGGGRVEGLCTLDRVVVVGVGPDTTSGTTARLAADVQGCPDIVSGSLIGE